MSPGDLSVGVMRVEINVWEDPVVGVPSSDVRLLRRKCEFGIGGVSAFDRQPGVTSLLPVARDQRIFFGHDRLDKRRDSDRSNIRYANAGVADRLRCEARYARTVVCRPRQTRTALLAKLRAILVFFSTRFAPDHSYRYRPEVKSILTPQGVVRKS